MPSGRYGSGTLGVPNASRKPRRGVKSAVSFDPNFSYHLPFSARQKPDEPVDSDAFDHPDARRRFRTIIDVDELEHATFAYPWDKWTIFLHPAQRNG